MAVQVAPQEVREAQVEETGQKKGQEVEGYLGVKEAQEEVPIKAQEMEEVVAQVEEVSKQAQEEVVVVVVVVQVGEVSKKAQEEVGVVGLQEAQVDHQCSLGATSSSISNRSCRTKVITC